MFQLNLPHTIQHRRPEISKHGERFTRHHRLVQHLPHHRKFHECSRSAFARHKSVRAPDQLEEPLFPGLRPYFHVNPRIEFRSLEKLRRHTVCSPTSLFRTARNRFHYSAVTAAANRETVPRQSSPQDSCLFVVSLSFVRPRTSKHRDDEFFSHPRSSSSLRVLVIQPTLRRRHIEFLEHRHAQSGQGIRCFVTLPTLIVA